MFFLRFLLDTGPAKQIAATGCFQNYHVCISVLSPTNFITIFGSHSSLAKMVGYLKGIELNFMKRDRGLNARTAPMYIKRFNNFQFNIASCNVFILSEQKYWDPISPE